jgi:hypothetical protein
VAVAKRAAAVCHKHGIVVVPELDLPGHQSTILSPTAPIKALGMLRVHPDMLEPYTEGNSNYSVCTKHPLLRPIACDMIDDLMDAFDTNVVHVGFDEVLDIGRCPRCKDVPPYQLLADLANDLAAHVKSRGGEMWMWGDRLLDGTRFPTANVGYETSQVPIRLLADGKDTGRTVTLSLKNGWTETFRGLPYANENGQVITYTVEEIWDNENWEHLYGEIITVGSGDNVSYETTITNVYRWGHGVELPSVGGYGRLPWILCGLTLMFGSLIYGLVLRRKEEKRHIKQ